MLARFVATISASTAMSLPTRLFIIAQAVRVTREGWRPFRMEVESMWRRISMAWSLWLNNWDQDIIKVQAWLGIDSKVGGVIEAS